MIFFALGGPQENLQKLIFQIFFILWFITTDLCLQVIYLLCCHSMTWCSAVVPPLCFVIFEPFILFFNPLHSCHLILNLKLANSSNIKIKVCNLQPQWCWRTFQMWNCSVHCNSNKNIKISRKNFGANQGRKLQFFFFQIPSFIITVPVMVIHVVFFFKPPLNCSWLLGIWCHEHLETDEIFRQSNLLQFSSHLCFIFH